VSVKLKGYGPIAPRNNSLVRALVRSGLALLIVGSACIDFTSPPPPVASVALSPEQPAVIPVGGTHTLAAIAKDASGATLTDRTSVWTSSDQTKATVASGLVTGVGVGSATITVTVENIAASVEVTVREGAVVGAAGGGFSALAGVLGVTVPPGALGVNTNVTVAAPANVPASARLIAGTSFELSLGGASPSQPIVVAVRYDPGLIVAGNVESEIQLYEVVAGAWALVDGSSANLAEKTVTGAVTRGGTYAVMMRPRVQTIAIGGDLTPIPVVTTRQLSVTLRDADGLPLTRPVSWSSSNASVLAIDPASGLASGKLPGSVSVTALSEGKSATATLTVVPGPPAKLIASAGNNQSAAAGEVVAIPPSVKVTDAQDNPISNVAVTFAVAGGGGSITGGAATTNAQGIAAVGSWKLGTVAGPNALTATSAAVSGITITFNAVGNVGPAAKLLAFSGNNSTATAGGLVASLPTVRVTDTHGNFVPGFTVTFTPGASSGTVTGGSAVTDAAGLAKPATWRLGRTPGAQTLIASASGLEGSPLTFAATGVAPVASKIAAFAGNNQTARPGKPVTTAPSVLVTDPADIPVAGVSVTFAATTGGGTVQGGAATTNADGIATVGSWTLGSAVGPNTLSATSTGLAGSPVVFNATAAIPPVTAMSIAAGNNQNGQPGSALPIQPAVKTTDAAGAPLAGVIVNFSVASGGGSIAGASTVSNASGIATAGTWTLGAAQGSNTLSVTSPDLPSVTLTFTATAGPPPPVKIQKSDGEAQTAPVNTLLSNPPSVFVSDANGKGVGGVAVVFSVGSGGGTITGGNAVTDALGIARVGSWRLGPTPGHQTLLATAAGLQGSPLTFNAQATVPVATSMSIHAGNNQSAQAGTSVATAPAVIVRDAGGSPVSGVVVTFSVSGGGGSISGATATTGSNGVATAGTWTLGPTAGANSLTASGAGLSVTFSATGTTPPPNVQVVTFGDSNIDLGFSGSNKTPQVSSYVSAGNPAIRLSASAPNSTLQTAGKIEAVWKANTSRTIKVVNHGITGTYSGSGRQITGAPHALEEVGGVSRFRGEVMGDAYPWNGDEPTNDHYPWGSVSRVQAFAPRTSDFVLVEIGGNDLVAGITPAAVASNITTMINLWKGRGLPANKFIVATISPRGPGESAKIPELNALLRALPASTGIKLIDVAAYTSTDGNGLTWKAGFFTVGDERHYTEAVRSWLADQVVTYMLSF
jgi:adhesin/invasin